MDYAALMAKNPHWTRQPDRAELMAEQDRLVEQAQRRAIEQAKKENLRMSPTERLAKQEQAEWERLQAEQDLHELLYLANQAGQLRLDTWLADWLNAKYESDELLPEWMKEPTK